MGGKRVDVLGQRFGKLTVVGKTENPMRWTVSCECGGMKTGVRTNELRSGRVTSCGCLVSGPVKGSRYGTKTVIKNLGNNTFLCECDCGAIEEFKLWTLYDTKSRDRSYCVRCRSRSYTLPLEEAANRELIRRYRQSATSRGFSFALSPSETKVLFFSNCVYCGDPPSNQTKLRDGRLVHNNGIDRVDNSKGYECGNVVSCCTICNYAKRERPVQEFEAWLDRLVKYRVGVS